MVKESWWPIPHPSQRLEAAPLQWKALSLLSIHTVQCDVAPRCEEQAMKSETRYPERTHPSQESRSSQRYFYSFGHLCFGLSTVSHEAMGRVWTSKLKNRVGIGRNTRGKKWVSNRSVFTPQTHSVQFQPLKSSLHSTPSILRAYCLRTASSQRKKRDRDCKINC